MRRIVFAWILCGGLSLAWANDFALKPSALFRYELNGSSGAAPQFSGAFGVKLEASGLVEGISLKAVGALWAQYRAQATFLEIYALYPLDNFELSLGKRTLYSGPWNQTLMGLEGQWGLFARYNLNGLPLSFELAYLLLTQGYIGARIGPVQAGALLGIKEPDPLQCQTDSQLVLNPRIGLELDPVRLYWQSDRGFWLQADYPLDSGSSLSGLIWWNPGWEYLDSTLQPEPDWGSWLTKPDRLFFTLAASWQDQFRLGLDGSIAPALAYKLWFEIWVR